MMDVIGQSLKPALLFRIYTRTSQTRRKKIRTQNASHNQNPFGNKIIELFRGVIVSCLFVIFLFFSPNKRSQPRNEKRQTFG
ncbi:hypothetical protein BDV26DRAFT_17388 [Aspergillus bertholletiae]|uniref:Uncharacterized protein n=1 Tax=Aspergillus bertholletiae TaxID=1226010 RepID=A0A5N7B2H3_9EURO|nr:hypothetical protein BDV26DRAFT_17388 [Aspergillus bertholletiae]